MANTRAQVPHPRSVLFMMTKRLNVVYLACGATVVLGGRPSARGLVGPKVATPQPLGGRSRLRSSLAADSGPWRGGA